MSKITTVQQHILDEERLYPGATGDFTALLTSLTLAAKIISREVNQAGLVRILGETGDINVHGEAVQPGRERRLAAELAEFLPGPDENVLRHLVGLVRAQHPASEAVDLRDVCPVEPLEGGRIPGSRKGHVTVEPASDRRVGAQRHYRRDGHSPATYKCLDGLSLLEG